MRRQEFLFAPSQEDRRNVRRRPRHGGKRYQVEDQSSHTSNVIFNCAEHHGRSSTDKESISYSPTQPVDPSSAKLVYLEAARALLRDRIQVTWGRVQQIEEMVYELFVEVAKFKRPQSRLIKGKVLEEFDGFLDKFDGDVAHVTLKTKSGEMFYGEYPAAELKAQGIRERRRFKCWTVEVGTGVEFVMEPTPDRELSEERERQIDEWLHNSLGDDDAPQNDY